MFRILIAEDDLELRELFAKVLKNSGYDVTGVSDGARALERLSAEPYDLVITDIMMPFMDGYELISELRKTDRTVPVLMITAKYEFDDMQKGFLSGTDDYMVKPVNVNEMVLRVGALLRRAGMIRERRQTIGGTVLDLDTMALTFNGTTQIVPQKEFLLLYKMASYPDRIFTRQQLMDEIWGTESNTEPHTVDVHVNRLRDRLRNNADISIVTMRGLGYKVVRNEK